MRHSLAQIGVDTEAEAQGARAEDHLTTSTDATTDRERLRIVEDEPKDYFVERNGLRFAGSHLIIDLWEAENLDSIDVVDRALRRAVDEAGATLLHLHLHHFTPNGGVSGVAVLAESHISIHTWPERGYAALDVFMCGEAEPHKVVPVLREAFLPGRVLIGEQMRGVF